MFQLNLRRYEIMTFYRPFTPILFLKLQPSDCERKSGVQVKLFHPNCAWRVTHKTFNFCFVDMQLLYTAKPVDESLLKAEAGEIVSDE